jgi:hypothetical protein
MRTVPRPWRALACGASALVALPLEAFAVVYRDDRPSTAYAPLLSLDGMGSIVRIVSSFRASPTSSIQTFNGSGVHIGNGLILTAAHIPNSTAGTWINSTIYSANSRWEITSTNAFRTHPSFVKSNYKGTLQYDLSLMWLGAESDWGGTATNGQAKLGTVSLWGDAPAIGDEVYMAGYGRGGTGSYPGTAASGIFRAGMNTLDSTAFSGAVGYVDFDSHLGTTQNIGSSIPLDLEALVNPGDSGGGWLKLDNEKLALTHITSGIWGNQDVATDGGYNDLGIGVSVHHYMPWIQEQAFSLGALQEGQSVLTAGYTILPQAPGGLRSVASSDSSLSIAWSAVQGATGYKIYRNGTPVGAGSTRNHTDIQLAEFSNYEYRVSAVNDVGEGPLSAPLSAQTLTFAEGQPRAIQILAPSSTIQHAATNISVTGRSGRDIAEGMRWSNRLTGLSGQFANIAQNWQVNVPLAEGTNVIDFRGFFDIGTPTTTGQDSGDSSVYADGLQDGDNGGTGFLPWQISLQSQAEVLLKTSETNPAQREFALWSPSHPESSAVLERKFTRFTADDTLKVKMRNRNLHVEGSSGVEIVDGEGARLVAVHAAPLGQAMKISDAAGTRTLTTTNAGTSLDLSFRFPTSGSYEVEVGNEKLTGALGSGAGSAMGMRLFSQRANKPPETVFSETFDYPVSSSILWQSGGLGFVGGWYNPGSGTNHGTVTVFSPDPSKWVEIGTSPTARPIQKSVTTGTSPVYISFKIRSPDFARGNYCGIGLVSDADPNNDLMFFGIPWLQDKFGFDARSGRQPLDIQTVDSLKPHQPYRVLVGLIPGNVAGRVDVKMWVSEDPAVDLNTLAKGAPAISLTGSDGKPNFTFSALRISGDDKGALCVGDISRVNLADPSFYEFSVSSLEIENNTPVWAESLATAPQVVVTTDDSGDLDNDGIPDAWEQQHFGDSSACDPSADPDADGFANFLEYILGTTPLDPASRFGITRFGFAPGGGVAIEWVSNPGKTYQVFATDSLNSGSWTAISPAITATSSLTEYVHQGVSVGGRLFYKVHYVDQTAPATQPVADAMVGGAAGPVMAAEADVLAPVAVEQPASDNNLSAPAAEMNAAVASATSPAVAPQVLEQSGVPGVTNENITGASSGDSLPLVDGPTTQPSATQMTTTPEHSTAAPSAVARSMAKAKSEAGATSTDNSIGQDLRAESAPANTSSGVVIGGPQAAPVEQVGAHQTMGYSADVLAFDVEQSPAALPPEERIVEAQPSSRWPILRQWWQLFISWLARIFA